MSPSRILLLTCAALVLMMKQMKADDSCSSGPCIVGLTGAEPSAITSFTSSSFTPLLTAVGCLNLVTIRFQIRKTLSRAPLSVSFCQRQPTGLCLDKGTGGGDDWIKSEDFARICCSMHPKDRDAAASTLLGKPASSMATCKGYGSNGYYDMYTCSTLQIGQSANDTTYETLASVAFVPPFGSDLSTSGQTELCFQVYDDQRTPRPPTCLKIQLQRCSVCLEQHTPGQEPLSSLVAVAKAYGTHWSQIYSSNQDIVGNPGEVPAGKLIRLGPLYQVAAGDTLISIALKFGVSVNQLLFWNKQLTSLPDSNPTSANHMSRTLLPGHLLCVLPKTCANSFGSSQPVFELGENLPPGQGGSWLDPLQVAAPSSATISA